jgi:hypothetical protein
MSQSFSKSMDGCIHAIDLQAQYPTSLQKTTARKNPSVSLTPQQPNPSPQAAQHKTRGDEADLHLSASNRSLIDLLAYEKINATASPQLHSPQSAETASPHLPSRYPRIATGCFFTTTVVSPHYHLATASYRGRSADHGLLRFRQCRVKPPFPAQIGRKEIF